MKRYLFNPNTKEYEGEITLLPNVLESRKQNKIIYHVPPNSTNRVPPKYDNNLQQLFFEETDWSIKIKESKKRISLTPIKNKAAEEIQNHFDKLINNLILINGYYFNFGMLPNMSNKLNEFENELNSLHNAIKSNNVLIKKFEKSNLKSVNDLKIKRIDLFKKLKTLENSKLELAVIYRHIPNILNYSLELNYAEFKEYYIKLNDRYEQLRKTKLDYSEKIKTSKNKEMIENLVQEFKLK